MDAAGRGYLQRDNCFIWLQDPKQAQQLMNEQMRVAWPDLLTAIAMPRILAGQPWAKPGHGTKGSARRIQIRVKILWYNPISR